MKDPAVYSIYLWLFTALLLGRVIGQIIVFARAPAWLPPMEQWQSGLLPYPALLAGQAVVLIVMVWISIDFSRGAGVWVEPHPRLGRAAVWWGYLYAGAHHLSFLRRRVPVDVRDVSHMKNATKNSLRSLQSLRSIAL